ncbi:MAG: PDZ domain-containing protein [bacterium]|nr:PDZ domain-containing protein [bacterium]
MVAMHYQSSPWALQIFLVAAGLIGGLGVYSLLPPPATLLHAQEPGLIELEQQALQAAANQADAFIVQIETFGGLERVGEEIIAEGPTTGTVLTADGWIISSLYSFRQQPDSILVNLPTGRRAPARIVSRDFSRELALLKVDLQENESLASVPVYDAAMQDATELVGSWVVAMGKTYSTEIASRSIGIISAQGRAYDRALQTDAKISPINYGGPLIDVQGRVLGILAPLSPSTFFEGDSSQIYDSGIGFAVPLADIRQRLSRMQQGNDIYPGKLGLVAEDQNELAGPVVVAGAVPGSPAGKAGVRPGDIVVEANGKKVQLLADLRQAMGPVDAGEFLELTVLRGPDRVDMRCELTREIPIYQRRFLGLRLAAAKDAEGLVVTAVEANSPASMSGLRMEQRIVACNGRKILSAKDLRREIAVAELDAPLLLEVISDDQSEMIPIRATTWPNELAPELAQVDMVNRGEAQPGNPAAKVVDLALGDMPNKGFAIVPSNIAKHDDLGLLILYPQPGPLDRDRALEHWQSFVGNHGWIIAIVSSSDDKQWKLDELELAERVLGRLQTSYAIDPARIVVGGLGVGGRLALIAGGMMREKVAGVLTVGTQLPAFQVRQSNFPLQSIDYLLVGEEQPLQAAIEALRKAGFSALALPAAIAQPEKWDSHPMDQIARWLEGLARY